VVSGIVFDLTNEYEIDLLLKKAGKKNQKSLDGLKGIFCDKKETINTTLFDRKQLMKDFLNMLKGWVRRHKGEGIIHVLSIHGTEES
jgi:hypothetical protein